MADLLKAVTGETRQLITAFAVIAIALILAYHDENLLTTARTAASLYWLFVLPGYAITLYWQEKLDFTQRIAIGTVAAMAMTGIFSYYLGLLGLKIQHQTILLPLALIAASFALSRKSPAREARPRQL